MYEISLVAADGVEAGCRIDGRMEDVKVEGKGEEIAMNITLLQAVLQAFG